MQLAQAAQPNGMDDALDTGESAELLRELLLGGGGQGIATERGGLVLFAALVSVRFVVMTVV